MWLFDVAEIYDALNNTRTLEADLEDAMNNLDEDTRTMNEKRLVHFEFLLPSSLPT